MKKNMFYTVILLALLYMSSVCFSQQIEWYYPSQNATNIARDAEMIFRVSSPYQIDTASMTYLWYRDSTGSPELAFMNMINCTYYSTTTTDGLEASKFYEGYAYPTYKDSVEIRIKGAKAYDYGSTYGIFLSGIKVYNTLTNDTVTIDTIILNHFTVVEAPIHYTGCSGDSKQVTCADNTISLYFSQALPSYTTALGPIATIDSISYADPDSVRTVDTASITSSTLNCTYSLANSGKELVIQLDDNFDNNTLYRMNVNLSRYTGNSNDDFSFSFKTYSVAHVVINSKSAAGSVITSTVSPYNYENVYNYVPGKNHIFLEAPQSTDEYVFNRWECIDNSSIISQDDQSNSTLVLTPGCDDIYDTLHFVAIYDPVPLDTFQFVLPKDASGNDLGYISATGYVDSINANTFTFRRNSDYSFCIQDIDDDYTFTYWEVTSGTFGSFTTECVTSSAYLTYPSSSVNLGDKKILTGHAEPRTLDACTDINISLDIQATTDVPSSVNLSTLFNTLKLSYNGNYYSFGVIEVDANDPRQGYGSSDINLSGVTSAEAQLICELNNDQYEILTVSVLQNGFSIGTSKYQDAYSWHARYYALTQDLDYSDDDIIWFSKPQGSSCVNTLKIIVRPRRDFYKIENVLDNGDPLPDAAIAYVKIVDGSTGVTYNVGAIGSTSTVCYAAATEYDKSPSTSATLRTEYYSVLHGTSIALLPYIDEDYGYGIDSWKSANGYTSDPVNSTTYELGPITMNGDYLSRIIFESKFKLSIVRYYSISSSAYKEFNVLTQGVFDYSAVQEVGMNYTTSTKDATTDALALDGYTYSTAAMDFIFNMPLDQNLASNAIIFCDYTLGGNGYRLDGRPLQIYTPILSGTYQNVDFLTSNGEYNTIHMLVRNAQGIELPHMSIFEVVIGSEKAGFNNRYAIKNTSGVALANRFDGIAKTQYPRYELQVTTVEEYDVEDWLGYDELFGFFWATFARDASATYTTSSVQETNMSRWPTSGTVTSGETSTHSVNYTLIPLTAHLTDDSQMMWTFRFYDEDCKSSSLASLATIASNLTTTLNTTLSISTAASINYMSLLATAIQLASSLCALDNDDFLDCGMYYITKDDETGNYWGVDGLYKWKTSYWKNGSRIKVNYRSILK